MGSVRKLRIKTKLATEALGKGGVAVGDALKRADRVIVSLRGEAIIKIDEYVGEIDRRFGVMAKGKADEPLEDLYHLSSEIIDVAFAIPESGVDRAARALCDLIDLSLDRDVRDWEAITVHIETLKMLRAMGDNVPAAQRDSVLAGLAAVMRKRVGV